MFRSNVYLVTGGAGFIGSHLVERLLELRLGRVILLDNFNDYYSPIIKERHIDILQEKFASNILDGSFLIVRGSINDQDLLKSLFNRYQITHVAHLAALAGVRSSINQTGKYIETNLTGTQILLDLAASHRIQQFVFASTSSVYGENETLPFVETDVCAQPLSPYAASKRSAEILAHVYFHLNGLNVTILRLFNVYGPRGRPDMMPFKLMQAAIDPTMIVDVFDQGKIQRDWTYVDDVIDGFISALKQPFGYEIMNIGCGNPISLSTFIEHIEQISGQTINQRQMKSHKTEPTITFCDNSKAKKLLNFSPKIDVRQGLEKMWKWFEEEYRFETTDFD